MKKHQECAICGEFTREISSKEECYILKDRELLELIVSQVGALTNQVGTLTNQFGTLTNKVNMLTDQGNALANQFGKLNNQVGALTEEVVSIKETVVRIENDHGLQLKALFDGYKQHGDKLDRIAAEVSKHEEVILRRIR